MKAAVVWVISCLMLLAIPSFAQETASTQLTLISDRDSFTLVVPEQTNLTGLKFVVAINGNQRTYELARFFSSLTLTNGMAEAGSCFRLIRNGSTSPSPLPGDCTDRSRLFMTPVGDADVFWFDMLVGVRQTVDIWRGDTRVFQCAFAESVCTFTWEVIITPTTSPPPSCGSVGQVAFVSDRDGGEEIYVMNTDGSNPVRLTTNDSDEDAPDWSPDGCRIVFVSERDGNREIYVMSADGTNQVRLTDHPNDDNSPRWSPDGTRIAFHSFRDGNAEIYVMNADGGNPTNLTSNPAGDFTPDWSPDGSQIVFTTIRDGDNEIYVMNADGSNLSRLTISVLDDNEPVWSPDGSRIAFSSYRDGNWEIYVMEADGSNPINLSVNSNIDISPVWSSDGTSIFFASNRDGNYEIYAVNADGSNLRNITNNVKYDAAPAVVYSLTQSVQTAPTPIVVTATNPSPTFPSTSTRAVATYPCPVKIAVTSGFGNKLSVVHVKAEYDSPLRSDQVRQGDAISILAPPFVDRNVKLYYVSYIDDTQKGYVEEQYIDFSSSPLCRN